MTGKTHRAGGMLCAVVGFTLLKQNGLLLPDVNEGLQLLVMYPFCMWGSIASDLDHHWESCPSKDIPSWCVNKVLHLTAPIQKQLESSGAKDTGICKFASLFNAKHRSWQTHSDLTLYAMIYILYQILYGSIFNSGTDIAIASLVITGLCIGMIAHLVLDMLTPEGVWVFFLVFLNRGLKLKKIPEKIHFVPKSKFFATGGKWELLIQRLVKVATVIAILYLVLFVYYSGWIAYLPFEISFAGGA